MSNVYVDRPTLFYIIPQIQIYSCSPKMRWIWRLFCFFCNICNGKVWFMYASISLRTMWCFTHCRESCKTTNLRDLYSSWRLKTFVWQMNFWLAYRSVGEMIEHRKGNKKYMRLWLRLELTTQLYDSANKRMIFREEWIKNLPRS